MLKLFEGKSIADICVSGSESGCVRLAVRDLANDLLKVTGNIPCILNAPAGNCITVGTLGSEALEGQLADAGIDFSAMAGKWENYRICEKNGTLYLLGSDERGTMWAVYEFSRRYLGVDPMYLFTGNEPAHMGTLVFDGIDIAGDAGGFRFRGWFINDEDLLQGFCYGGRTPEGYDFHADYAPVLAQIIESALRLKQNLLIPASHIDIDDPVQEALVKQVTDRGMFISMHHVEPVGVSQPRLDKWYTEHGDDTKNINYADHPEKYRALWRHYIRKWAGYPNVIWQLGLRGRGDRPVWYQNSRIPDTPEARGKLISNALQDQWDIIAEETGRTDFLSTTTLWMEGMPLYRAGTLKFPKGTVIVLSDFGPDQTWGDEYYDTPRIPGRSYGLYYHACFWGCGPHLVQGNRPGKMLFSYAQAAEHGDMAYSVLNVSNIREHVLAIRNVADICVQPRGLTESGLTAQRCAEEYGEAYAARIAGLYNEFYDAFPVLDDRRVTGRMLLMDGMCRRLGLMLMEVIRGGELHRPDIQNKRLFDFDDTDSFIRFYARMTEQGMKNFSSVLAHAYKALSSLPEDRSAFFRNNLMLQAVTMRGLYSWVNALCEAAMLKRSGTDYAVPVAKAADSLREIKGFRDGCADAKWKNWYEGDRLMNICGLAEMTEALGLKQAEK